jgi:hypothetical protein
MGNANLIHSVILDSATTVTTQTSRSSRTSRSKGPSKSTILRNKQKEKEELDNQILLQEVKDRYETLAVSAPQEFICLSSFIHFLLSFF